MRPSVGFSAPTATSSPPLSTVDALSSSSPSAWHSPVPYLFGGLAAMLGLIAFALLILACSYWKLSGYLEGGEDDAESGNGGASVEKPASDVKTAPLCYEQRVVVIMAGQEKPTFLATPISSRASSFGDHGSSGASATSSNCDGESGGGVEMKKMESDENLSAEEESRQGGDRDSQDQ